jgi:hypothetical protein
MSPGAEVRGMRINSCAASVVSDTGEFKSGGIVVVQ